MQALLYKEQLVLHGCLAKAVDGGDHWAWKRHWVSLERALYLYLAGCAVHSSLLQLLLNHPCKMSTVILPAGRQRQRIKVITCLAMRFVSDCS